MRCQRAARSRRVSHGTSDRDEFGVEGDVVVVRGDDAADGPLLELGVVVACLGGGAGGCRKSVGFHGAGGMVD